MKNLSDEELVALFAQGDNAAFDVLLGRHKNNLFDYIYSFAQNRELTEDIFQDTFIRMIVMIKSGRYESSDRFVRCLFRVAHNRVVDHFRHESGISILKQCDMDYDLFDRCDLSDDMVESREEEISRKQILNDIRRMIKYLPENQQEIIRMRYYKNMSFKQICEILNCPINTALGRIHYALNNLRKLSEQHHISLSV